VDDRSVWEAGPPDVEEPAPCRARFGLAVTRLDGERRHAAGAQGRLGRGARRAGNHGKAAAGLARVAARGRLVRGIPRPEAVTYEIMEGDEVIALDDVQWADWDADGRLLVATREGRLEARDGARPARATAAHADLAALAPAPVAPPAEAARW
jgi:hypothetical protein